MLRRSTLCSRETSPAGDRVMYATNGRVQIYYEVAGAPGAPPLVLLRGLGRTVRHWGTLLDLLGDRLRVVVLDNRGVGRSSAPLPPYDTGVMATDVLAVLDHAGILPGAGHDIPIERPRELAALLSEFCLAEN